MTDAFHLNDFEAYQNNNPYMKYNHIELCSVGEQRSVVRVKLVPESKNLHGAVHGGLLYSLADCVAGVTARASGDDYVTQSEHMNFLRNTHDGILYSEGTVVKRGRQLAIIHVTIYDQNHLLLADGVVDMIRMHRPQGTAN